MVIVAVLVLVLLDAKARFPVLISLSVLAVLGMLLLSSTRGLAVQKYIDKIFKPGATLASRTAGRSEQWRAFPAVFSDSPIWGFGPGSGVNVSLRYSGKKIPFHSLYLHFGAETGIVGLAMIGGFFWVLLRDGIKLRRSRREIVPLMATLGFSVLGLSVIGMDSLGGMWVGLGLIAGNRGTAWVIRRIARPSHPALQTAHAGIGRSVA